MKRAVAALTTLAMLLVLFVGSADARPHANAGSCGHGHQPTCPPPTPTPTPTPTPVPTPTPTPPPTCPPSLQVAINGTATGGTLTLGSCVFHEAVTITRAITIVGPATITGDLARTSWASVTAADVTIDGLTFTNAATGGFQCGSVDVSAPRFTLKNATLSHGCYSDVRIWVGADNAQLLNNNVSDGPVVGVIGFGMTSTLIDGGRYHDNRGSTDVGNESGGIKLCGALNVTDAPANYTIRNAEVDHNVGPGIWLDCYANDSSITFNNVHDNTRSGIMDEITARVQINNNTVYRNARDNFNAFVEDGIMVSSGVSATVTSNIVAWNGGFSSPPGADIGFISQNRQPYPHTGNSGTGNILRSANLDAIRAWQDYPTVGSDPTVTTSPNTFVTDTDPRIAPLQ